MQTDRIPAADDARSLRRWLHRVVLPLLLRFLIIVVLIVLLVGLWGVCAFDEWIKSSADVY